MNKYEYIFDPSEGRATNTLVDHINSILNYTGHESGELEGIEERLENTQTILMNVVLFLVNNGLLKGSEVLEVLGSYKGGK